MPISVSGKDGVGKSTLARELADDWEAVLLSADTVLLGLARGRVSGGLTVVGVYFVLRELAVQHLRRDRNVVVDAASPMTGARDMWRTVAQTARRPIVEIELTCADAAEHRRRVEQRITHGAAQGIAMETWEQIQGGLWEPWTRDRHEIETSRMTAAEVHASARLLIEALDP